MTDLMAGRSTLRDHIRRAEKVEWRDRPLKKSLPGLGSPTSTSTSTTASTPVSGNDSSRKQSNAPQGRPSEYQDPRRAKRIKLEDDAGTSSAIPTAVSEPSTQTMTGPPSQDIPTPTPMTLAPKWYTDLKFDKKGKVKYSVQKNTVDRKLQTLASRLKQCKTETDPNKFSQLAIQALGDIHAAFFLDNVDEQMIRNHFLLTPGAGLQIMFDSRAPWFVQGDALELFNKWSRRDLKVNLFRGIKPAKGKNSDLGRDKAVGATLVDKYEHRRYGTTHGANGLVVGQWVPTQLCLLRDGAHMATQGGISGKSGQGAWSLVMSGGVIDAATKTTYPNIDEGDTVYYCGTDGTRIAPSDNTALLLENERLKLPVRFIRSSAAPNKKYAPEAGFRYDGLYDVVSHEILDSAIDRHRFKLVRRAAQYPLRCDGPGKRPTANELAEFKRIQEEKKFYVDEYIGEG